MALPNGEASSFMMDPLPKLKGFDPVEQVLATMPHRHPKTSHSIENAYNCPRFDDIVVRALGRSPHTGSIASEGTFFNPMQV